MKKEILNKIFIVIITMICTAFMTYIICIIHYGETDLDNIMLRQDLIQKDLKLIKANQEIEKADTALAHSINVN